MKLIKNINFKKIWTQILHIFRGIDTELWPIGIFFLANLVIGQDKIYLLSIVILLFVLYKINKNFMNSLWITFLTVLPFGRGRFYDLTIIPMASWGGNWDLVFQPTLLYSDLLLGLMIYVLFTRFKKYRNSLSIIHKNFGIYLSLFAFVVLSAIGTYLSQYPTTSLYFYVQLIKLIIIFFVAIIIFNNKKIANLSLKILLLFIFVNAVLIIGQYINKGPFGLKVEEGFVKYLYADENPSIYRPGGFFLDPNIAATIFSTFLPILLVSLTDKRKLWGDIKFAILCLVGVALILTGSRSAWVVTTIVSGFMIWYLVVKRKVKIYVPSIIRKYWIILTGLFLILLGANITGRISTILSIFDKSGGGTYRLEHIQIGWHYLITNPFGIGVGAFPFRMALDFPVALTGLIPNVAHNIFAQIGAETGFPGLIAFLIFLWLLFKAKYKTFAKSHDILTPGLFFAFISFFLMSNFFPWFLHPSIDWVFWILAAYGISNRPIVE